MASYTNETGLVKAIVRAVKKQHPAAWIMKVHGGPMQMAGIPDLLICVNGLLVGAEAKHQKPGESEAHARGRATPIQRNMIHLINTAGGMAGVVLTPQETLDLIARGLDKRGFAAPDEGEIA
jgi:hypothetical protein